MTIQENIEVIKRSIEKYVNNNFPPFQHLFSDIKGISSLQFARLITEIRNMNMFKTESKQAAFAGQAPRRSQSGSYDSDRKRNGYNRHLAYLIHMVACTNVREGDRFHDEYSRMKKKYNRNLRALKNIKRKIVRLIYYKLKEYWGSMDKSNALNGDSIYAA